MDFLPSPQPTVFLTAISSCIVLGLRVLLDLTPNYRGQKSWFLPNQSDAVATKMRVSVLVLMAGGQELGWGWVGPSTASPLSPALPSSGPFLLGAGGCTSTQARQGPLWLLVSFVTPHFSCCFESPKVTMAGRERLRC